MFFGKAKKEKAELVEKYKDYDNVARLISKPLNMPGVRVFLDQSFVLEGGIFIYVSILKGEFKMHDKVFLEISGQLEGPFEIAAMSAGGIGISDCCAPFECCLIFKELETASILNKCAIVSMNSKA